MSPTRNILALSLKPFGSFGNQIISFVHARFLAKVLKIRLIVCPPGFFEFQNSAHYVLSDDLEIVIAGPKFSIPFPPWSVLRDSFFWAPPVCEDWSWKDVLSDGAAEILRQSFPPLNLNENQVVLVLRGGAEMWTTQRASGPYSQAPCGYFLDVMRNFSEAIVVGGDGSPCRELALNAGGRWVPWDQIEGTRYMLWAKNVIFARTSRSHGMIALAPFLRRFWMFDIESEMEANPTWWRGFKPYEFGEGYDCVASRQYRSALTPWIPTEKQKEIVRYGKCTFKRMHPPG
jgi:hypothetical protein